MKHIIENYFMFLNHLMSINKVTSGHSMHYEILKHQSLIDTIMMYTLNLLIKGDEPIKSIMTILNDDGLKFSDLDLVVRFLVRAIVTAFVSDVGH